jgi:hypothetical protein
MKAYWGIEVYSTHSLTSALDGGEWSASRPGRFTPRERAPDTHWIGGWTDPRDVLDAVVRRKFPAPAGNRTLEPRSTSANPIELSRLLQRKQRNENRLQILKLACYILFDTLFNHSKYLRHTRVNPIPSGLATWSENCKWYSSLPLGSVVSLPHESVYWVLTS